MVILDSGVDISVLPMNYGEVGFPLERVTSLRDIQGGKMINGGMRQAMVELEDEGRPFGRIEGELCPVQRQGIYPCIGQVVEKRLEDRRRR